jgi:hypothetical protein
MFFASFLQQYFIWHYSLALTGYIRVSRNFAWFIISYFSITTLLKTLLAPFKRIQEKPSRRFNFEDWIGTLLINLLSRLIGAVIRSIIIIAGLCTLIIYTSISLLGFAFWLILPFYIFGGVIGGIWLLFF